jgi:hypothetical protein
VRFGYPIGNGANCGAIVPELQVKRLQVLTAPKKIERLNPQTAVYVLVEFIKNPKASSFELSVAVEKKGVKASQQAVAQLFKDYDFKKNPP